MKGNRGEDRGRRDQKRERIIRRGVWDEEGREEFIKEIRLGIGEEREIQREIEGMKERIGKALEIGKKKKGKEKRNRTGWWDEECRERKKEVRKELRKWRKGEKGIGIERGREDIKICARKRKERKGKDNEGGRGSKNGRESMGTSKKRKKKMEKDK